MLLLLRFNLQLLLLTETQYWIKQNQTLEFKQWLLSLMKYLGPLAGESFSFVC